MELWLIIVLAAVGACCLCCVTCCLVGCCKKNSFVSNTKMQCEGSSEIIMTKKGAIEINRKGNAPYAICLHGAPGMHDGYSNVFDDLVEAGIGVIAPSRPGYGRTPVESGPTPPEAADLLAALLDELSIDAVHIYCISGGGATGLNFGLRHPDRCKGVLTEVACIGNWVHPMKAQLLGAGQKMAITSPGMSQFGMMMLKKNPAMVMGTMMETSLHEKSEKEAIIKEICKDQSALDHLAKAMKVQAGASCYPNTWNGFQADIAGMEMKIDFAAITVPVLLCAGDKDGDVPLAQAEQAAEGIPGAELCKVEGGWHLLCFDKTWPEVRARQIAFMKKNLGI